MNSVGEESKLRLPKLVANITLALTFGVIGTLSSVILVSVTEGVGFYSWLVLTLVGGVFLIRVLFDVLTMGDTAVKLFLKHLGIHQRLSKRRIAKDLMGIIATILATAAIFPFLETLGPIGTALQSVTTIVAVGMTFLFVYDITRTLYNMFQEKVYSITDWLVHKPNEVMK
ncbi:MAG: hypothetical protein JSV05_02100 [Candidatus Bathyarchaeota archaeon]|nr:MAG: hypothetical protein JSV05_02100 [Candidatus Bathyarchaeota archaeon]